MNEQQILEALLELGGSMPSYGRFYKTLTRMKKTHPQQYRRLMDEMVSKQFKDNNELMEYLEG